MWQGILEVSLFFKERRSSLVFSRVACECRRNISEKRHWLTARDLDCDENEKYIRSNRQKFGPHNKINPTSVALIESTDPLKFFFKSEILVKYS